nr:MAG TPA: hypothetical protein [Caudoviricetes sp.]
MTKKRTLMSFFILSIKTKYVNIIKKNITRRREND